MTHAPENTVQYSLAHGGWTVVCRTCRAWYGPFVAQDYAQQVADFDHAHPDVQALTKEAT